MSLEIGATEASKNSKLSLLSRVGIGTIAWGDTSRGYGTSFNRRDVNNAVKFLVEHDVNFFDTAEVYGYQSVKSGESSEQLLGDSIRMLAGNPRCLISSKFFPVLWTNVLVGGGFRIGRKAVLEALRGSITRLGVASLDLYIIHFPFPYVGGIDAIVDGFSEAYDLGLIQGVGVSNYNRPSELRKIHEAFAKRGVPLLSNQVRYNILDRSAEKSGLLETANELGIMSFAYEPLAKGLLTGKFTDPERLVSPGRRYTLQQLNFYRPLTSLMKLVGSLQGRDSLRSITEVAIAYIMSKGVVPVVGVKTEGQARELARAADPSWFLEKEYLQVLDEKSDYLWKQKERNIFF